MKKSPVISIAIIGMMFFFVGFSLGINSYMIPFLKNVFDISSAQSYLILASAYSAFVLFGYPSGKIVKRVGYKKSMMISFFIFSLGLYLFVPSANYQSFPLFLLASLISGLGNTLLQAAINPYVTILGPFESAARRISIMGILNKLAWAVAPWFLSIFLDLQKVELADIDFPFMLITAIFLILGVTSPFLPLPEIKMSSDVHVEPDKQGNNAKKKSVFHFPHLLLGVLALFLFSGMEALALASILDFASYSGLNAPEQYASYTVVAMIIGYVFGIVLIPGVITQKQALQYCAVIGVVSSVLILAVPSSSAIYFIALLGLANSLMWPTIWPLALNGLGDYTNEGSALLVMGIAGGAIIPLVFGWLTDANIGSFTPFGMQRSYSIGIPIYLYVLYYALKGHKMSRKQS